MARMGVKGNLYRVSVVKIEGERRLGRLRHKCKTIIKMHLKNGSVFFWICVAHDSYQWQAVNTVMVLLGL